MGFRTSYKRKRKSRHREVSDAQLAGNEWERNFEKIVCRRYYDPSTAEKSQFLWRVYIHTTIDVNIQDVAETSLMKYSDN
jgi:hypothetical protein